MAENNSNATDTGAKNPAFDIIRLYVKDLSLETPNTPDIFRKEWKPETKLDIDVKHRSIDEPNHVYEVVLRITATVAIGEDTAFLAEVNQASIFHIENFPENQLNHMLNAFIPGILFPYARELVSDLSNRASFPPLNLAPINFDAIYAQRLQQQAQQAQAPAEEK